ncbi:hypothetical protein vseg_006378 [Gypsophila vaccaria]
MRVRDMHPLCCITLDHRRDRGGGGGDGKSKKEAVAAAGPPGRAGAGQEVSVAGPLYKWTNYGKGWRSRWFLLRADGRLSYTKIMSPQSLTFLSPDDVTVIGDVTSARIVRVDSCGRRSKCSTKKPNNNNNNKSAVVQLEVSTFRGSRSDDRRFYIFTATKTLHLRTNSKHERELWLKALAATRSLYSLRRLNDSFTISPSSISISTERLKKRLLEDGVTELLVNDCEQIMRSEFAKVQGQLKALCDERSHLLDTLRQLEAANIDGMNGIEHSLTKRGGERAKYSECSTTESSDDTEKQDLEEASEEEEHRFYDTKDHFTENLGCSSPSKERGFFETSMNNKGGHLTNGGAERALSEASCSNIVRRAKLPEPAEKEKAVSLWSMIKDNVGKDLTRVCLPVYFNEPISSLQKCCEDMEYSHLLDRAYEHGKAGNSLMRIVNVAAFAVSGYASTEGRLCKPFNPLLGETYEADYPEKGFRFFSEKVSHHPTLVACHCEGRGWKFWADSNIKSRFWGQSIQLDPVGLLTLEFDDGEIFQWSKVTTSIHNLIIGKIYCDHHGTMSIRGNRQYSCILKFKGQSFLDRSPNQVHGSVEDATGRKVGTVFGKWDDSIYFNKGDGAKKLKDLSSSENTSLIWKRTKPTPNLTRYNLTNFAITLNELTPGLEEKLPPTDSRLRPDQRHLENGEYDRANTEKLRLERRQRMSRKLQEDGWKPKWFEKEGEDGTYHYKGGYWEARRQGNWDGCPNIFGEINDVLDSTFEN